jgi:hypothetical protein
MDKLIEELKQSKENTQYLLEHANALVDMHGLKYWAGEVERIREEIKKEM